MKKITILYLICFPFFIQAQVPTNQDCMGAIPVCQNVYSQPNSFVGQGNYPNEIPTIGLCPGNCLMSGELNNVWYVFTVQQSGNLNFTITPNNSADDYNWAVYNITNVSCSDIFNNIDSLQVSCNYSDNPGPTGANGGSTNNCQSALGTANNAVIPVFAGQTYVLNVSNFSSTQFGYTLDFSASTAVIFDNIAPYLSALDVIPICGDTTITFDFSENILCNTVSADDFSINGPGGPYFITSVTSFACGLGGNQEKTFTITLTPAITASGNYQICLNPASVAGSVTDLCGNIAPVTCLNFVVTNVTTTITQTNENCGTGDGTATVIATGGSGTYIYTWSTTPPQSGQTATGLAAGTYTVTVDDGGPCPSIISVTIENIPGPTAAFTVTPNPIIIGEGMVFFTNHSIGGSSYLWKFGDGLSSNSVNPIHSYGSADNYKVWLYVFNDFGCVDSIFANIEVQEVFTLYTPNAFSPNMDGINDYFMPLGLGVDTENYSLKIFDRWGKLVFHTNSINVSWDGSIDGIKREELITTVYTYVIDFKDRKGLPHQKRGIISAVY